MFNLYSTTQSSGGSEIEDSDNEQTEATGRPLPSNRAATVDSSASVSDIIRESLIDEGSIFESLSDEMYHYALQKEKLDK